jgi:tetratricopeptide (TPR) repeat protein
MEWRSCGFENPSIASERIAGLVAGNALPENVAREIAIDGLGFRPDDHYRALLKTAGADAKILSALSSAKVLVERAPDAETPKYLLQHLAAAGKLINEQQYDQVARELSDALAISPQSPETGFVMGQLLRQAEQFDQAVAIYMQVLHEAPDFPEVHAKLSYILHRMDDSQGSLTEAKAALKVNAENAEAHKNAGLALEDMRKEDASLAEYCEALRLKPDYEAVRLDLGLLYCNNASGQTPTPSFRKQPDSILRIWTLYTMLVFLLTKWTILNQPFELTARSKNSTLSGTMRGKTSVQT